LIRLSRNRGRQSHRLFSRVYLRSSWSLARQIRLMQYSRGRLIYRSRSL